VKKTLSRVSEVLFPSRGKSQIPTSLRFRIGGSRIRKIERGGLRRKKDQGFLPGKIYQIGRLFAQGIFLLERKFAIRKSLSLKSLKGCLKAFLRSLEKLPQRPEGFPSREETRRGLSSQRGADREGGQCCSSGKRSSL